MGVIQSRGPLGILACEAGMPFAIKIFNELKNIIKEEQAENELKIIDSKEIHFANTELKTEISESIRGRDVYIVQDVANSTLPYSVNDNLLALYTAIDAARRCDAHYITVILPYFPYSRQDKAIVREAITASLIADHIESAGADRVVTLDIHNSAIAGFFKKAKLENLHASHNIMKYVSNEIGFQNLMVSSTDLGGVKRADHYAEKIATKLGIVYKKRDYSKGSVEEMELLGMELFNGAKVLFVDDMIATAGTAKKAIQKVWEKAKPKEIHYACSLPLFNGKAVEILSNLFKEKMLSSVIGTDAVHHGDDFLKNNPWYKEVSVAKYFAKVIFNINHYLSLSGLLE